MNISYKWLIELLPQAAQLTPQEVADALTSIGLETGSVTSVETIKGGLRGLVIGQVESCVEHPNSDHLHCTTVSVGTDQPLRIVCGAPNVAAGQHVVVATIGTTLYDGDTSFTIKKSKLRGEESFGMICSEVEIGIGTDQSGIMVLPDDAPIGMPAAEYFGVEQDYCLEVDITPNRVDATSHFGVARDLAAYLTQQGKPCKAQLPTLKPAEVAIAEGDSVKVTLETVPQEVARYQGVTIEGVTNGESPKWLRDRLHTLGLRSINLLVDLSNYILHEVGQPLHFFDADKIAENNLIVTQCPAGSSFTTLDGVARTLKGSELMICDGKRTPLCMAGIMGGEDSGVSDLTTRLFIESASFNSTLVRKAARSHGLNTDSSFRFERGLDPDATHYALQRALQLVLELAGGKQVGKIIDLMPLPTEHPACTLRRRKLFATIGGEIDDATILRILESLDIHVIEEWPDGWLLSLPVYRIDVRREVDVIEEILRIYGYNQIPFKGYIRATLSSRSENDLNHHSEKLISEQLVGMGYQEVLSNSLSAEKYYQAIEGFDTSSLVHLLNPLSQELCIMRYTLLFGGLEAIARNFKNKQPWCAFYEWGNCYSNSVQQPTIEQPLAPYQEFAALGLWLSGAQGANNWLTGSATPLDAFHLKAHVEAILSRMHIAVDQLTLQQGEDAIYSDYLSYTTATGQEVARLGVVRTHLLQRLEIEQPVYYAQLPVATLMAEGRQRPIVAQEIAKYPIVKRDFALLLNQEVTFAQVEAAAKKAERKLLQKVELFDVYTGKNLPANKKSYAVSFWLQDTHATLTEKQIEGTMKRIRTQLEKDLEAELR